MLKFILIGLLLVVAALAVAVSFQPSDMNITRTVSIAAAPDQIFPHVNDFKQWEAWSPYEKLDPDMKKTYTGPATGVGSIYSWDGNNQVGQGQTKITSSTPNEKIGIELKFERPFKGTNDVEFAFKPEGTHTVASWTMTAKNNFISKAMGLVIDMDKMIGSQFEEGLNSLKKIVESAPKG